jgi:L-iditol 2-dehydrogenase
MENMGVDERDTVLVTGLGPVGLGAIVHAVARGARAFGVGRSPYRTALARELGAALVFDPQEPGVVQRIRDASGGGVSVAIECSAAPMYQRLALDAMRRRGRLTFLAESGELELHVDRDIIQQGLTIFGSLDLYLPHAEKMMACIGAVGDAIDRLVTHRLPLSQIREAWEAQLRGECGKVVLYPFADGEVFTRGGS